MNPASLALLAALALAALGLGLLAGLGWISEHPYPEQDPVMNLLARARHRIDTRWMAYWRAVAAKTPRRHLASSDHAVRAHQDATNTHHRK